MSQYLDSWIDGLSGEAPLIETDGAVVSRHDFLVDVLATSRGLTARGLSRGGLVPIVTNDPVLLFRELVATWLAGGVGVPISPLLPPSIREKTLALAGEPSRSVDEPGALIFTSGSTGLPKGVLLRSEGLLENAKLASRALELTCEDRLLITTPPTFTSAINHFLAVTLAGGTYLARSGFFFGDGLARLLGETKATAFGGAPTHLIRLVDTAPQAVLPQSVKRWISSGDHLPKETILKARAAYPGLSIYTFYGLTEVSGRLCVLPPSELPHRAGSVGRPLPGMTVTVRRANGNLCEPDETGECFVTGPLLMERYWASRTNDIGELGFPTGDYGYFDRDGFLWLTGRRDDLFKSGAEKISTVAIQQAILATGKISDGAILAVEDHWMGKVPVAFLVPKPGQSFDSLLFLGELRSLLSPSQVPKRVFVLPEIPRTGAGKADVSALRSLLE